MKYRYLKNLREEEAKGFDDIFSLPKQKIPKFNDKADFRAWCADKKTDSYFISCCEGLNPNRRIDSENKIHKTSGVIVDCDAPVDWDNVDDIIAAKCTKASPAWRAKTYSGYIRLGFLFENEVPVNSEIHPYFVRELKRILGFDKIFAGYDTKSESASQYFALGSDIVNIGGVVPNSIVQTALIKAAQKHTPKSEDTAIPMAEVAKEVDKRFPNRWVGEFEVGSRGPLFWIDDGIEREGCQVFEDGMLVYSDRSKGWMTWKDIFGVKFVKDFEEKKMGDLLDSYWFNGKNFYGLIDGFPQLIPKDQLVLELRKRGFRYKGAKKGETLSEVEDAILVISQKNRVAEMAPIVFRRGERVVEWNGQKILNTTNIKPIEAADSGDKKNWPFLYKLMTHMFVDNPQSSLPSVFTFWAWHKRFYEAILNSRLDQGHTMVLCGPSKRGKTLLSTMVVAPSVGGFADGSDYLSGQTKFNKEMGRTACWVIDDTTSASNRQEQMRLTEMLKRSTANPRMDLMPKYGDAISIPWAGRAMLSLNDDPNSMSVIPNLDSSNRDKIIAFRINPTPFDFPDKKTLEDTIKKELPYYLAFLKGFKIPDEIKGDDRFGVKSFIDPTLSDAAYDSSTRARAAEILDMFSQELRATDPNKKEWRGTFYKLSQDVKTFVGSIEGRAEDLRRDVTYIEELCKTNKNIRPVKSEGTGGGKILIIDITEKYDIDPASSKENQVGGDAV
jgi:hypothetical protein|tara:strand:- start:6262 stop:8439 length:2178 start_codon:yes stop_codon:yes gene_type:complete